MVLEYYRNSVSTSTLKKAEEGRFGYGSAPVTEFPPCLSPHIFLKSVLIYEIEQRAAQ